MLTKKQKEAVDSIGRYDNIKVFGSAGTGKTRTLIAMYSEILKYSNIDKIASIAFNKAVADEIANRVSYDLHIDQQMLRKKWCATFHGFARRLLVRNADMNIQVLTPTDLTKLFIEFVKDYRHYDHKYIFQMILFTLNNYTLLEENNMEINDGILYGYGEGDIEYHNKKDKIRWNLDDYRDFLQKTQFSSLYRFFRYHRFQQDPKPVSFYELLLLVDREFERIDFFDAVLIDEVQDLSPLQWRIVKKIKGKIMLYGDDDQSIYGYRGANPKEFLDFPAYPIILDTTFRFNTRYARMLESGLRQNISYRQPKQMKGMGSNVKIDFTYIDTEEFTPFIKEGAILSRTNKILDTIAHSLDKGYIPYIIEKQDVLDRVVNPLAQKISKVFAFIDAKDIQQFSHTIRHFIRKKDIHYSQLNPSERIQVLTQHYPQYIEIFNRIQRLPVEEKIKKMTDVEDKTLSKQAKIITENIPQKKITRWITEIRSPKYTLATVHRAKGREWDNVLIVGFRNGSMPLRRPGINFEEEARIAYVALSRTKANLYLDDDYTPFINFLWEE